MVAVSLNPRGTRGRGRGAVRAALLLVLVAGVIAAPAGSGLEAADARILGVSTPTAIADDDTASVELGVRFVSARQGVVAGISFYKSPQNLGPHTGTLWTGDGESLATVQFSNETESGWQTATFEHPVAIAPGTEYVASYFAPHGRYAADVGGFRSPMTRGDLTVPAGGGVFAYGSGGFPSSVYQDSNYFVDVLFHPGVVNPVPLPPGPVPAPTPPSAPPAAGRLDLPRIPWEGGPDYWKRFAKTDAAGWDDPSFFPIISWYGNFSNNEEVAYDKSLGINTYSGMWEGTPYQLFADNGVYWIGNKLNESFGDNSANWVGHFLDDEVDGRYTVPAGQAHLQSIVDAIGDDGRFKYANFTQMVVGTDLNQAAAQRYVNSYTDTISIDMYWYTIPYCDNTPYRDVYLTPVSQANCRTSSSYGKMVNSLRLQDAADGRLQPLWQWVENLNGGPGSDAPAVEITPGQLQGAVMNSIINEARGIAYFNQSLSGSCQSGNVFRQSQVVPGFCGAAQVAAVKEVNSRIHALAPVINTQSYDYTFGRGLDTMLKTDGGFAYIFAMIDGSSQPGSRTFALPAGVHGRSVEVLDENRTLQADGSGHFSDSFAHEYSFHIYRIAIG
jgi:hypothetical protein